MNSEDKIRKQFQSKFNDFTVPPPSDGWMRLDESLNNISLTRKMVVRRRWQYASSVAVILLLMVGGLFYMNRPEVADAPLLSDAAPSSTEVTTEVELIPQSEAEVVKPQLFVSRSVTTAVPVVEEIVVEPTNPVDIIADYIDHEESQDYEVIEKNRFSEESIIAEADYSLLYADYDMGSEEEYILSFGGKGGLTSFHQTVNSPMTLRSAAVPGEANFIDESEKMFQANNFRDNIAEMEHDQPISFGVTISKSIAHNLSVETGLIYSYLYSKSKNTSNTLQNKQTQSLHYLGVPLNLNYQLFSLKDLNVYVSLGGMIEKDVYGKFREEGVGQTLDDQSKSVVIIDEKITQRNPQLSVNTGLGLSYPIYKDLKLYGKIGGAYYFDAKNEFKTIYSDRKIVMDLSLGLRYEFK